MVGITWFWFGVMTRSHCSWIELSLYGWCNRLRVGLFLQNRKKKKNWKNSRKYQDNIKIKNHLPLSLDIFDKIWTLSLFRFEILDIKRGKLTLMLRRNRKSKLLKYPDWWVVKIWIQLLKVQVCCWILDSNDEPFFFKM